MACEIDQVAGGREHLLAPARDLDAGFGQRDVARTAFDQVDPKQFFEVADLHGKRRLAHRASLRRAAEMPVLGKGLQDSATGAR